MDGLTFADSALQPSGVEPACGPKAQRASYAPSALPAFFHLYLGFADSA
jgi:hypothetical protein